MQLHRNILCVDVEIIKLLKLYGEENTYYYNITLIHVSWVICGMCYVDIVLYDADVLSKLLLRYKFHLYRLGANITY